jgi:mRNA-degrading endonuclease RelE of RelBE toxin-antitoxin system
VKPSYTVELAETVEAEYLRMAEEAERCIRSGDDSNAKVKRFRMVEEALDRIIPHDPVAVDRSLGGPLAGIYRVKKGRMRICYIVNREDRRIIVVLISELRKDGDANDPYRVLQRMLNSGKLDDLLAAIRLPATGTRVQAESKQDIVH